MALYAYKAADTSGKVVRGTLEAGDEKGVAGRLQDMGYIPIDIRESGKRPVKQTVKKPGARLSILSRVSQRDVMRFTIDLSALLSAGLPIDKALGLQAEVTEKEKFKAVVTDILKSVQGGAYLSDAMARHPGAFSDFYINMVRAGEAGGVLEAVLERLGVFLESAQDLRDEIKSALYYPAFLVLVSGISIIVLMTFVLPKFSVIFSGIGGALPVSTKILLGTSEFLIGYWWAVLAGIAACAIGFQHYANTPAGRTRIDGLKLSLPVVSGMVRHVETARFARTLGTLIRSGVPILQALELVKQVMTNKIVSAALKKVHERVKEGDRLSAPLKSSGVFPPLATHMIKVGEESGRLGDMLLQVAENYEKIVRTMIKRFVGLLEPAMILIMGLMVGFIVISMLTAIFSINELPF